MNEKNGEAVNTLAKGAIEGTAAFLGRICLPAAEEFGLLLQDKVKGWRAKNFISIARKTQELLKERENQVKVHPRILHQVYENGSWVEDDALQSMWAGLLASSCDTTGKADDNLIYVNILSQLTTPQAKLFEHVLKQTYINVSIKIVTPTPVYMLPGDVRDVTGIEDIEELDQITEKMIHLGLFEPLNSAGNSARSFSTDLGKFELIPTSMAIRLFLLAQGITIMPSKFYRKFQNEVFESDDEEIDFNEIVDWDSY